jgi:ABC-type Fe3+-hydroxamate transport system substrate-binding protein
MITVSGNSYINSIIESAGGINVFKNEESAYPILGMESLLLADPDAVITMLEGDRDFLAAILKKYSRARFIRNNNIFSSGDGSIPYHAPGRYVEAVETVSSLLVGIKYE